MCVRTFDLVAAIEVALRHGWRIASLYDGGVLLHHRNTLWGCRIVADRGLTLIERI